MTTSATVPVRSRTARHGRLAATVLLLMGLLALPAGAAEFHTLAFIGDAVGDTGGVEEVDLIAVRVNYPRADPTEQFEEGPPIEVDVFTNGPIEPASDPAWRNDGTALSVLFSDDGDDVTDVEIALVPTEAGLAVTMTDGDGDPIDGRCNTQVQQPSGADPQEVNFLIRPGCFGEEDLRVAAMYTYEATEGGAVGMDRVPDSTMSVTLPRGDAPPFCDNRATDPGQVEITRLRCGGEVTETEPITQAVAVSQFVFDNLQTPVIEPYLARWAVIVRDDAFADALAGSSLGFGQGPLLFAHSPTSGPRLGEDHTRLPEATMQELLRTLPRGFPVYVLGGTSAVDEGVVDHLLELGYNPIRLAGPTRIDTAAIVADEVRQRTLELATSTGFPDTNMVMIANADNWPDAVLAGQIGALWGYPILLSPANGVPTADGGVQAPPATLAALDRIRPHSIVFVGGQGVVTSDLLRSVRQHAIDNGYGVGAPGQAVASDDPNQPWRQFCGTRNPDGTLAEVYWVCRQGGDNRVATGAAVSQFGRELIQRFGGDGTLVPDTEVYASGVPIGGGPDSANFTYVLAASMMSGRFGGAVFLPTEHGQLTDVVKRSVCDLDRGKDTNGDGVIDTPFIELVELVALVTDVDNLPASFGDEIRTLIEGKCPPEFTAAGTAPALGSPD